MSVAPRKAGSSGVSGSFSSSDQDIAKLIRSFIMKASQLVVHSRVSATSLPQNVKSPSVTTPHRRRNSKLASGIDTSSLSAVSDRVASTSLTFNFEMEELPSIKADLRNLMTRNPHAQISLDILLKSKSPEEAKAPFVLLERWTFHYEPVNLRSQSQKKIYTRLIILLRSLFSLTRLLPVYPVVKLISSDSSVDNSLFELVHTFADSMDNAPIFSEATESFVFSPVITSEGKLHVSVLYQENCDSIMEKISASIGLQRKVSDMANSKVIVDFFSDEKEVPKKNEKSSKASDLVPTRKMSGDAGAFPSHVGVEPLVVQFRVVSNIVAPKNAPLYASEKGVKPDPQESSFPAPPFIDENSPRPEGLKGLQDLPPPIVFNSSRTQENLAEGRVIWSFSTSVADQMKALKKDVKLVSGSSDFEEQFFSPQQSSGSHVSLLGAISRSAKNPPALRTFSKKSGDSQQTVGDLLNEFETLMKDVANRGKD